MSSADVESRMLPPDEAQRIVFSHAEQRSLGSEVVPLAQAAGRLLAQAVVAHRDLPPFAASTMDGFALLHDDPSDRWRVIGSGLAGDVPSDTLTHGVAARIMTGAPLPDGATTVVPVEQTQVAGEILTLTSARPKQGDNIRPIGADMRTGDRLLQSGTRLGPAELGLIASLGHATIAVGRVPRVIVITTGDELVQPGGSLAPGQIYDSNGTSLGSAVRLAGAQLLSVSHITDDEATLVPAVRAALAEADVVITSGGVSMGDRDLIKAHIAEVADVHFRRLFMKPGKPFHFATAGRTLFFGLSGNPVSNLVGFHVLVAPALRILQGAPAVPPATVVVRTTETLRPSDRIEYQRANVQVDANGQLVAHSTGSQSSARLMSFAGANALVIVPVGADEVPAGTLLPALLLAPPVPVSAA